MESRTLFRIERVVEYVHYPEVHALVGVWQNLASPEMRAAGERAAGETGRLGVLTWIIDLTHDPGVPSQADLKWMLTDGKQLLQDAGVMAVVNIHGASALASMGVRRWSKQAPQGTVLDCRSLDEALEIAREVAEAKAGDSGA